MTGDMEFVRSLADFLAVRTEQSSSYFKDLIKSFLRGDKGRGKLDGAAKNEIVTRLQAELDQHSGVPSFLQNYLLTHLLAEECPSEAAFAATRYLRRPSRERFVPWRRRQQLIAELIEEPIPGTELGFRQMLYGQGVGAPFRWRGVPCFKTNNDIAIYAMLIDELRPATIIELGSGAGGSALYLADLCTSAGLTTEIISVDAVAVTAVSDPRIAFIQSDCAAWLETTAKSKRPFRRPCLMIEDFHGDLAGFFPSIDHILADGDYLFIEDSSIKQPQIARAIADRPYLVDAKYTDFFGVNCTSAMNGILLKNAEAFGEHAHDRRAPRHAGSQDRAWREKSKREA